MRKPKSRQVEPGPYAALSPSGSRIFADPELRGFEIPGITEKIISKFFADDTSLYLNKYDRFDTVKKILKNWCEVSGAKFNIEKTEIVPIGSEQHRKEVSVQRKINPLDETPFEECIRIAKDGDAIRLLGAWIGNNVNDLTPWEPIIDRIKKALNLRSKMHPTMRGRSLIVQAVIGGHTQFLSKAQGMPSSVKETLTKIIRDFMWEEDSSPRISLDFLHLPPDAGGLGLLDIRSRNEAIDITWLKAYLNFTPSHPTWAKVTDPIITLAAVSGAIAQARVNSFLQIWKVATKGNKLRKLNNDITRMLRVADKYDAKLAAILLSPELRSQLPAWYHIASTPRPITNKPSKCLLKRHAISIVADLLHTSERLRGNHPTHRPNEICTCEDCIIDRTHGCQNPHACATEALTRIHLIFPKLDPLRLGDPHDNLSLTKQRKTQNRDAKLNNDEVLFDPSITCKDNLAECFRIFTNPDTLSNIPAQRYYTHGVTLRCRPVTIYTNGACLNNGKQNATCGSGIWFAPNDDRNQAIRVPGERHSIQIGEIVAILKAASSVPKFIPLIIISDSSYAINGLTHFLNSWENKGWIGIKNATFFKKTAAVLKQRTATTIFKWVKGHNNTQGNEEADKLAKEGAAKCDPDIVETTIPKEFDLQGAKLATISQSTAYKGILERKSPPSRRTTLTNLQITREALTSFHQDQEMDSTIWNGLRNTTIRLKIRQFLYKALHGTQKVGHYWSHIHGHETRSICASCESTETMDHILIHCQEPAPSTIWSLARQLWPHSQSLWPTHSLGIILGCGTIHLPHNHPINTTTPNARPPDKRGIKRLLQILISESAHLIWVLRCERVIQERRLSTPEVQARWFQVINARLSEDKITATRVKRNKTFTSLVSSTWEPILSHDSDVPLPRNWLSNLEVLVGTRMLRPRP